MGEYADDHGDSHGDRDPHHGDAPCGGKLLVALDSHEPDQNMRHAEISKPPCHQTDDGEDVVVGVDEGIQHILPFSDTGSCLVEAQHHGDHQGEEHQRALDEVGGDHRHVAAGERVADNDQDADHQPGIVAHAED